MASAGKLVIPEPYKEGFSLLAGLDAEQHANLEGTLAVAEPTLFRGELASFVSGKTGLPRSRARSIIDVLTSLYILKGASKIPVSQLASDVTQALREEDPEKFAVPDDDWEQFTERLVKLLNFDHSIGVVAKALDVMSQHERAYCNAETRVLTDLRPVFPSDATALPTAAVIIHMLKLAYHEGGEVKSAFIALDESDVTELREVLERAEAKAKSLRSALSGAPIRCLSVKES